KMENKIVAYCGIICSECDAYKATQSKDQAALERVAAAWREQFSPEITAASIACDGCLPTDGALCGWGAECPIRACAIDRGVNSCAHCPDYGCDTITEFLSHSPETRKVLDAMRASYLRSAED
ncbi:MAG: DUF3795 domain-containing protein, partial [Anaerolineae bacterium]